MGMVETCDKNVPNSTALVPNAMPWPKEPFHLVADRTRRRRLQELQQVVTKELAAPYTVKYLPDTGQIVLTQETRVVVGVPPEPSMEERLIMAVCRIRSLHLSRTESRYLVGSIAVPSGEHDVRCGMGPCVQHASAASGTGVAGVHCIYGRRHDHPWCGLLPTRLHRPPVQVWTTPTLGHHAARGPMAALVDGCIGCLLRWMVHRGTRPSTSIARLVAPPAPTNYLVGGYWWVMKSGRASTRPPKKSIMMMSCARPQP